MGNESVYPHYRKKTRVEDQLVCWGFPGFSHPQSTCRDSTLKYAITTTPPTSPDSSLNITPPHLILVLFPSLDCDTLLWSVDSQMFSRICKVTKQWPSANIYSSGFMTGECCVLIGGCMANRKADQNSCPLPWEMRWWRQPYQSQTKLKTECHKKKTLPWKPKDFYMCRFSLHKLKS